MSKIIVRFEERNQKNVSSYNTVIVIENFPSKVKDFVKS